MMLTYFLEAWYCGVTFGCSKMTPADGFHRVSDVDAALTRPQESSPGSDGVHVLGGEF
jgi:hypothetical protein